MSRHNLGTLVWGRAECFKFPNLIHVMVASLSLIAFITQATLFSMAEMDLNPLTANYLAMSHSRSAPHSSHACHKRKRGRATAD